MNNLKYRLPAILFLILFIGTISAQTILTKVGRHPFIQPSIISTSDLITVLQDNKSDVEKGFELAGQADLFDDFMMQLPDVKINKVNLPQFSRFKWMLGKRYGTGPIVITKDITWVSKTQLSVFQFYIDKNGDRFNFAVPLICGNIALRSIVSTPEAIVVPIVDEIEIPSVSVKNKKSDPVYQVKIAAPIEMDPGFNFLTDLGYYHQFDPGGYLLARGGVKKKLNENLSTIGLIGVAKQIWGSSGKTALILDLLGEYQLSSSFIDVGLGVWFTEGDKDLKSENTQVDLIVALGVHILGKPDAFNVSIFLETRNGLGELNSIDNIRSFGRWGGGLRFRF